MLTKNEINMEVRYIHNCDECIFLGQYENFDLYYCEKNIPIIISRYDNDDKYTLRIFAYPTSSNLDEDINRIEAVNRTVTMGIHDIPKLTLTEKEIKYTITYSKTIEDGLMNIYKRVYNFIDWNKIENIHGFPKVNQKTAQFIIGQISSIEKNRKGEMMMMWVNQGFSIDDTLKDWEVKLTVFSIITKKI